MNPELEQQLVEIIESARKAGTDASSFIAGQAPDVAAQVIRWEIVNNIIGAAISFAIVITCTIAIWRAARWLLSVCSDEDKFDSDERDTRLFTGIFIIALSVVAGIISLGIGISDTLDVVKAYTAPKLILIDYVKEALGK